MYGSKSSYRETLFSAFPVPHTTQYAIGAFEIDYVLDRGLLLPDQPPRDYIVYAYVGAYVAGSRFHINGEEKGSGEILDNCVRLDLFKHSPSEWFKNIDHTLSSTRFVSLTAYIQKVEFPEAWYIIQKMAEADRALGIVGEIWKCIKP